MNEQPANPQPTAPTASAGRKPQRGLILLAAVLGSIVIILAVVLATVPAQGAVSEGVGKPAPAFKVTGRDGKALDNSSYAGQVVVLNFFASWCKPCQEEAGDLEAIWKEYDPRGVAFLGITYQDSEARVATFIEKYGLTYPVADDTGNAYISFGITGVPETYVIGRDGKLVFKRIGAINPAALRKALDDSLR